MLQIALAQINPIVGDLNFNLNSIIAYIQQAQQQQVELLLFPELALLGYPADDLLMLPDVVSQTQKALETLITFTQDIIVIIGVPRVHDHKLYNSAAIIMDQKLHGFYDKMLLPTYDVFAEARYFTPGHNCPIWNLKGHRVVVTICEDMWPCQRYNIDPLAPLVGQAVDLCVNLSASPFALGKVEQRLQLGQTIAQRLNAPFYMVNQVGGQDGLIFDGHSFACDRYGSIVSIAHGFQEELFIPKSIQPLRSATQQLSAALILGLQDYVRKVQATKVCLGLSGGIDSALVALLAQKALGPDQVYAYALPSRFTSQQSMIDARLIAHNLKIQYQELCIDALFQHFLDLLIPIFGRDELVEQNIQARIRAVLLMAFSNHYGALLLSTSNKSELSMGYSTLYGDTAGALAVIGDLTKEQVYQVAQELHEGALPESVFLKEPSAELAQDQKDSDQLPSYPTIDLFIEEYVQQLLPQQDMTANPRLKELLHRFHRYEFKRAQSAFCLKVSTHSLTVGRKMPIAHRWCS